jgi:hypothetical protein
MRAGRGKEGGRKRKGGRLEGWKRKERREGGKE